MCRELSLLNLAISAKIGAGGRIIGVPIGDLKNLFVYFVVENEKSYNKNKL